VLSGQERRVLSYLGGWLTTDEIAALMHVSRNTVKTYQRGIYRKLGVHSRAAAVAAAARRGWGPAACPTCGTPI
jgi:LuxR family maltose regulon positive regulatory protein